MVPENIRKIERPKKTALLPTKHGNIYMFLQRIGCIGRWKGYTMEADQNKKYYAWDSQDIKRGQPPFKVNAIKHTWIEINR